MVEYKYAYPSRNQMLFKKRRESISPIFQEEIEVVKLTKDMLIGNLVHFENSSIGEVDINQVRTEDVRMRKKYYLFGKLIEVVKPGWVRLKKTTRVEFDLKNYRTIRMDN